MKISLGNDSPFNYNDMIGTAASNHNVENSVEEPVICRFSSPDPVILGFRSQKSTVQQTDGFR